MKLWALRNYLSNSTLNSGEWLWFWMCERNFPKYHNSQKQQYFSPWVFKDQIQLTTTKSLQIVDEVGVVVDWYSSETQTLVVVVLHSVHLNFADLLDFQSSSKAPK